MTIVRRLLRREVRRPVRSRTALNLHRSRMRRLTGRARQRFGVQWRRPTATPDLVPIDAPATRGFWSQSNVAEVREAQKRADAGDPESAWQVDWVLDNGDRPSDAAILAGFLTEELGWDGFRCCPESFRQSPHFTSDASKFVEVDFLRCAGGASNALYPDDPNGRTCAPTLDNGGYERMRVTAHQRGRQS